VCIRSGLFWGCHILLSQAKKVEKKKKEQEAKALGQDVSSVAL